MDTPPRGTRGPGLDTGRQEVTMRKLGKLEPVPLRAGPRRGGRAGVAAGSRCRMGAGVRRDQAEGVLHRCGEAMVVVNDE